MAPSLTIEAQKARQGGEDGENNQDSQSWPLPCLLAPLPSQVLGPGCPGTVREWDPCRHRPRGPGYLVGLP